MCKAFENLEAATEKDLSPKDVNMSHKGNQVEIRHLIAADKNLVYYLAHHESPIAQWLERPTSIWKVMGSTPVEGSGNSFLNTPLVN